MAYQATVLPVMIASPGDVSEEREIVRTTLHEWNDLNSETAKVMLAPVGWESHSSPELGIRPQELINQRLVNKCDLLIGVFWTRLGTPSGEADSGTVEEIEKHVAAGRPAMIYFSSRPLAPGSYDEDQFKRLQDFKKSLIDDRRGLIGQFDTPAEFRLKLWHQLQRCLNENAHIKSVLPAAVAVAGAVSMVGTPSVRQEPPELSEDAKYLLLEAAKSQHGQILKMATLGGKYLIANQKQVGERNPRESARWESALSELVNARLVASAGPKNQVYELTHTGWILADSLGAG